MDTHVGAGVADASLPPHNVRTGSVVSGNRLRSYRYKPAVTLTPKDKSVSRGGVRWTIEEIENFINISLEPRAAYLLHLRSGVDGRVPAWVGRWTKHYNAGKARLKMIQPGEPHEDSS